VPVKRECGAFSSGQKNHFQQSARIFIARNHGGKFTAKRKALTFARAYQVRALHTGQFVTGHKESQGSLAADCSRPPIGRGAVLLSVDECTKPLPMK
jgi:hypothetical protein